MTICGAAGWLKTLEIRSELTPLDQELVLSLPGTIRHTQAHRDLVRLGERVSHVHLVLSGVAARIAQTQRGARQLTAMYFPGDAANLVSFLLPNACCALTAVNDLKIFEISHDALLAACEKSPTLMLAFWRDTAVEVTIASEWLLSLGQRSARERIAHFACELSIRAGLRGDDPASFEMNMTQDQLGEALGLTAVHMNRKLRELRDEGLVTFKSRRVQIQNFAALAAIADFDPAYLHLGKEPIPTTLR